jgi:transcription initiation factor IIE alpha subunit
MSCPLEELVRLVAYMFYEDECTMVLIGLLELGHPVTTDELSNQMKLKLKDLSRTLGRLRTDGLISVEQHEDLSDVEDPSALSAAQRKKRLTDYYSLDFKSFVDSVHLRILLIRANLSESCGSEDNIFYECPKCKELDAGHQQQCQKYIFPLRELVAFDSEGMLICPQCQTTVEELDDSAEINEKKALFSQFVEMTEPLLNLIRQTNGLVMIDDPEERCKPDQMMPLQEYEQEVEKIKQENDRQRVIRKESWSNVARLLTGPGGKMDVVVLAKPEDQVPARKLDPTLERLLKKEAPQKYEEVAGARPTIVIDGKTYTADQIDQTVLDAIDDDDEFDRVSEFKKQNS